MKRHLFAVLLLAVVGLALPAAAGAQDPQPVPVPQPPPESSPPPQPPSPPPPPPPPAPSPEPREFAVPRGSDTRMPETRVPSVDRVPDSDSGARGREITVRDGGGASRRSNSSAGESDNDQGNARRPGSVRRPPAGGGTAIGNAVPRDPSNPPRRRGDSGRDRDTVFVYNPYYSPYYARYYDPWGYGAFGLGYFYYSPWSWSGYGYGTGYYPQYPGAYSFDVGSVKLKVKPRDAEVWVDGYYAGVVDDFDGVFQSLKLDAGAYRIEMRKPGFEPLQFDVRVQPDRTITFRGEMKQTP